MVLSGATVQCKDLQSGGAIRKGQLSQQFTVPANLVGHFLFQKEADACILHSQLAMRDVPDGSATPETMRLP